MNSHELARQLLALPEARMVVQAGHPMREGDCADEIIDLSGNLNGELCLEVGDSAR